MRQGPEIDVFSRSKTLRPTSRRPPGHFPEDAFSRIAHTPLVHGNKVRLLRDAEENYPRWLEAIRGARHHIHFESYIIHDDEQGRIFSDALKAKAGEGVEVRVIYDWLGGFGKTRRRFWSELREGGVEVRCYNPFSFIRPFAWINRDHRKILTVDGDVAFVTGLCVGNMWTGSVERGIEPWRDTGVEIRGKAVADVDRAFAEMWGMLGTRLPESAVANPDRIEDQGDVALRVVASNPGSARIYRLDQLLGSMARETLWLTDAYFSGTDAYVETLRSAASDGVDVRLLVPAANDILIMSAVARSGYRVLLEAGVRIFEWNGSMLHSKSAVIDGFWSRVGSTNLNVSSFVGNAEIDVLIEDGEFGRRMQEMYIRDLENATEIVLTGKRTARPVSKMPKRPRRMVKSEARSARYAPTAIVIGSALSSAVYKGAMRKLSSIEWKITSVAASMLILLGLLALRFPKAIAVPFAIILFWLALAMAVNSVKALIADRRRSPRYGMRDSTVNEGRVSRSK